MSAQLIYVSDDAEPVTYRLDKGAHLETRDAVIAKALMQHILEVWDYAPRYMLGALATEPDTSAPARPLNINDGGSQ
jgi:hypothetical protein